MTAYIICSRLSSSRVPGKPLTKYNGITQIELLIRQLEKTKIPIFLAVPFNEVIQYSFLIDKFPKRFVLVGGDEDDPLKRMHEVAKKYGIKKIIRVTHDKIFIEADYVQKFVDKVSEGYDYVFSSGFIAGSGFEVISFKALHEAAKKYSKIEFISYAVKALGVKTYNYPIKAYRNDIRLLIDYPEDVRLMHVIFGALGTNITLDNVVRFLDSNNILKKINKLPLVTIYTCAKDAAKWIQDTMKSVRLQNGFDNFEYILTDDGSSDKTLLLMAKFCAQYPNAKLVKNDLNLGLASSSNNAAKIARGKYIVRIDADDFFVGKNAILDLVMELEQSGLDVVYPDCFFGLSKKRIQKGNEKHHAGGALFRTAALNHVKFTDKLRNYDSLDLFARAKDQLKIGYYEKPVFVYRQHNRSMSRSNTQEREETRAMISEKYNI
jgi:spore coat polysaccharide biosynthesis protein SpsF (cytidylyltransferase family)